MKLQVSTVWLATLGVDMRQGIDGLSLIVQQLLGRLPCDGSVYVFCNRRRPRLKLICWDGNGVWLCQRRLHRGQFIWPDCDQSTWAIDDAPWQWLIQGVDWQRRHVPAPAHWQL
jgi:transposase